MKPVLRSLIAAVASFAAFYYVYWVPIAIFLETTDRPSQGIWMRLLGSLLVAVLVALYTWRNGSLAPQGPLSSMIVGALVTGAVAFAAGFYGPIIFDPGSQGPLLGIVIGPLGFLAGAISGLIYWVLWGRKWKISHVASND